MFGNDSFYWQVIIDGIPLDLDKGRAFHIEDALFIRIYDFEVARKIGLQQFYHLPKGQVEIDLAITLEKNDSVESVRVYKNEPHGCKISFDIRFDLQNWKQLWSAVEYSDEFKRVVDAKDTSLISFEFEDLDSPASGFSVHFHVNSCENIIDDEIEDKSDILEELHKETILSLRRKVNVDSIAVAFDFPEEVRVPCEQYLLYFAQFLKDLGVEADTALTHDAGQVLFTVTPNDKQQALDKIRAALEVYLHLPSSPVSDPQQGEIAILRLNSELQNFQSKLSLARAEIQMKEAAIQLQKVTIAQLTGEVVIDSLKDVTPKPKNEDKEEILGNMVSLIPIKGKGVEIHLPEIVRKLKELFKEKGTE